MFIFLPHSSLNSQEKENIDTLSQGKVENQQQVLVLMDADLPLYRKVLSGFALETDYSMQILSLGHKQNELEEIQSRIARNPFVAIIAIGPKSLILSQKFKKPIFYTMVPQASALNLQNKNINGIAMEVSYIQQLEILKKLRPKTKSVGVFFTPKQSANTISSLKKSAVKFGIEIAELAIHNPIEIASQLKQNPSLDALFMISDRNVLHLKSIQTIMQHVREKRTPVMSISSRLVSQGALFSLQVDYTEIGRQLAQLNNHLVIEKSSISRLPLQRPKHYVLYINLSISKEIEKDKEWAIRYLELSAENNFSIKSVYTTED